MTAVHLPDRFRKAPVTDESRLAAVSVAKAALRTCLCSRVGSRRSPRCAESREHGADGRCTLAALTAAGVPSQ